MAALERVDVVEALIERDGKVLVVHTIHPGHVKPDRWGLPGGGRGPGEALVDAAAREVREETGLEAKIGELVAVREVFELHHVLFFTFRAAAAGEPSVQEGEVVVEIAWVTPEEGDALMPWYGSVRALLDGRVPLYAVDSRV